MLKEEALKIIRERIRDQKTKMTRTRRMVRDGVWDQADEDAIRRAKFFTRRKLKTIPPGAEAARGPSIDFQNCAFLVEGADIRRAVAYVEVNTARETNQGSGFLISPHLFLTNQHVIRDKDAARSASITFMKELDKNRRPLKSSVYTLDPDAFAVFSDESDLDFALIAIGSQLSGSARVEDFGYCPLSDRDDKHVEGMPMNIIQHPNGWSKMVTVRNNLLVSRTSTTLLYDTDTEVGSSGSPVFNDEWDVVALHHYGVPFRSLLPDESDGEIPHEVNEGIRASKIVADLRRRLDELSPTKRALLEEALSLSNFETATSQATLSPPRPSRQLSSMTAPIHHLESKEMQQSNGIVRITIDIDTSGINTTGAASRIYREDLNISHDIAERTLSNLTPAAEAKRLDRNYANRKGYQEAFIPEFEIALPKETDELAQDIAPLRATEPDAAQGLLNYQNFSVKLSRSKRLAIYTATNIFGREYLNVNRDTGKVTTASEGETWYKEPRVSETFYLAQDFYSQWSHYFDRGHLTRRADATWGTVAEAERANADTFHFSNCSPQHFRFNQTAKYWQGLELYVLENGLRDGDAINPDRRISVFQGPIFDDTIDYWCDDIQIPSAYWKLVLWVSSVRGARAVALIAEQGSLMQEIRKNLGPPRDLPSVDVSHWRVPVQQIENRTGLKFDQSVRDADTIKLSAAPTPGEERAVSFRVSAWEDLLK